MIVRKANDEEDVDVDVDKAEEEEEEKEEKEGTKTPTMMKEVNHQEDAVEETTQGKISPKFGVTIAKRMDTMLENVGVRLVILKRKPTTSRTKKRRPLCC